MSRDKSLRYRLHDLLDVGGTDYWCADQCTFWSRDERAARLVDGGATYKAAGEALGVHERTIARMVKRHREKEKESK